MAEQRERLSRRGRGTAGLVAVLALATAFLGCGGGTEPLVAGPASAMLIVAGDAQSGTVGAELPMPVVVRVTDDAGLPVKGQIVNFRVVAGGGSVFAGASLTNDAGEARERWTLGTVAGESQRVEARAVDPATGAALVFATMQATAVASAAAKLRKASVDSGQAPVATVVPNAPSVKVVDQFDNPVAGTSVAFAVISAGGSITGATQTSNAAGVATVSAWTLGTTAGANTVTATAAGLAGSPVSFLAFGVAGEVATVTVSPANASLTAMQTQQSVATLKDVHGNTVTGATAAWISSNPAVATASQTGLVTAVALGSATITATSNGQTGTEMITVVPSTFTAVTTGADHSCGLTSTGSAYCWGNNRGGELGDGTVTARLIPTAVKGGFVFSALTAGNYHTCGLTIAGAAYCWGSNELGKLGDGTATDRVTPATVQGGLTFTAIKAGAHQTCGLVAGGAAYCWGSNGAGQLGDGTTINRTTPVAVQGGLVFKALAPGGMHTCGLTPAGSGYCWGWSSFGALGYGEVGTVRFAPVAVAGGLVFTALAAGEFNTCGLTAAGATYCWGSNESGTVGDGTNTDRAAPAAVAQGSLVFTALMHEGGVHFCGLTSVGGAYCWGANFDGQLGDGTTTPRSVPTAIVASGLAFTTMAGGYGHTCALAVAGALYCWGRNDFGRVGDGTQIARLTPVAVLRP